MVCSPRGSQATRGSGSKEWNPFAKMNCWNFRGKSWAKRLKRCNWKWAAHIQCSGIKLIMRRLSLLGRDNCFSPRSELKTPKGQTGFWGSLCSLELLLPIFPFRSDLFILSPDPAVSKCIWLLFKETGSHWATKEKAVTSRSKYTVLKSCHFYGKQINKQNWKAWGKSKKVCHLSRTLSGDQSKLMRHQTPDMQSLNLH